MQNFVPAGKAKTVFRLIEMKAMRKEAAKAVKAAKKRKEKK